jgi:thiol-disulfide isomerase/thioredoxin
MDMTEVTIGPLVLPASLLVTFTAVILGVTVGNRIARSDGVQVERVLLFVIAVAVLTARAAFVGVYWDRYANEPWRIIDVRDGGFRLALGVLAAVAAGAWVAWRQVDKRKAVLAGVLSGTLLWVAGTAIADLFPVAGGLPELSLTDLEGKVVPLSALAGKPVVLNVWATWCPPCRREMPVLKQAQRTVPGVTFVFVNQGESAGTIRAYLGAQSLKLENVLLDPTGSVAAAAHAPGLPTTLFFDAGGKLVDRRMGELSPATLAQRLELLARPALAPVAGARPK